MMVLSKDSLSQSLERLSFLESRLWLFLVTKKRKARFQEKEEVPKLIPAHSHQRNCFHRTCHARGRPPIRRSETRCKVEKKRGRWLAPLSFSRVAGVRRIAFGIPPPFGCAFPAQHRSPFTGTIIRQLSSVDERRRAGPRRGGWRQGAGRGNATWSNAKVGRDGVEWKMGKLAREILRL